MLAQGEGQVSDSELGRNPGLKSFLFIGRAVRWVYRRGVTEAETEFALFRPYLRGFCTPRKHSADVKHLERNPGLRPLEADLPWANIGTPRWGFSFRFAGEVFSILTPGKPVPLQSPASHLQPLSVTRPTKFPEELEEIIVHFLRWAKYQPEWLTKPDEETLCNRDDAELWINWGRDRGLEPCRREGCEKLRVRYSVFCPFHHWEQVFGRPCPFDRSTA
jgi:hypothetical protein